MGRKIATAIRSFATKQLLLKLFEIIAEIAYINETVKRLNEKDLSIILRDIDGVISSTEKYIRYVFETTSKCV